MEKQELEKLLRPDLYQVFLFSCPATVPVFFAAHPWFVVNKKGEVSRWEIFWHPQKWEMRWGHLHKDFYEPFQGIAKFPVTEKYLWKNIKLLGLVEGEENSLAHKMAAYIESSPQTYPFCHTYSLRGPNSNTYVQWVLKQFSHCGLSLPWNAFGKRYNQK